MLSKKRKYTYEEIKEAFENACNEVIIADEESLKESMKQNGKEDRMFALSITAKNMVLFRMLQNVLFGEDGE